MPTLEEQIQELLASQQAAPVLPTLPRGTPDDGTRPGLLGRIGEVLAGGQSPTYRLGGREADAAGNRALLNFGLNMLQASGPSRVRPDLLSAAATGLQGAQQSMDLDQRRAAAVAQQDYQQRMDLAKLGVEQNRDRIERMKAGLSLLQLQNRSQPLDEPGTGTAGAGGGGAGGGALQFTGDKEKDRLIIQQRESGGDPTALNYVAKADPTAYARGATAGGLYGFTNTTWAEGAKLAGVDVSKYPEARKAPPKVQDAVFDAIYDKRGTAPWDPSKWGQNWVRNAAGGYDLVKTGTGGTSTPPPYKVAGPPQPPPTGSTPPPPTQQPPAAPAAQAALPEAEARAKAAETGQPVPMLGADGKPSGLVIKPDGSMANAPPPTATAPTATAPAPQQPDDTIGLPPGVPGYRAFREANLRQPTPEERRLFGGELTEADKKGVQTERAELERALQNAQRARQLEGGDASTIVAARQKIADHEAKVREAATAARKAGEDREAKWWEQQETQLTARHGELIKGAETRLTADNAVTNARKTKVLEGVDSDVALTGDRIGSLEALRVLSKQVGSGTLIGDIQVGGRSLADIITATGWGGPELGKKAADVQQFQAAVNAAIKDIKSGVAMGAVSDRDLIFLENMVANPRQDERTRNLIITGLIAAQERKRDVAVRIGNLVGSGVAPHQAIAQAHKEVAPIFRQVPPEIDKGPPDKRGDWFRDNVRPGQLYRRGDNTVDVYPGPDGAQ